MSRKILLSWWGIGSSLLILALSGTPAVPADTPVESNPGMDQQSPGVNHPDVDPQSPGIDQESPGTNQPAGDQSPQSSNQQSLVGTLEKVSESSISLKTSEGDVKIFDISAEKKTQIKNMGLKRGDSAIVVLDQRKQIVDVTKLGGG